MIKKHFDGMGTLVHAMWNARKLLSGKKDGTTLQITYLNGYANFIVKKGKVVINSGDKSTT